MATSLQRFARLSRFLPFLAWAGDLRDVQTLRVDVLAGITVALVLIPQSMAYAQLAGLPAYYGLYASFLPPIIAALFGSSRQLATGPVAVVSLLSAAALEPLATAGSEAFIAYAILLALLVGIFQLSLGLLRLGVLVNFLAHPVVLGFTNAAAIIIATSQLSKIFGVSAEKAEHHYETVWNVVVAATEFTHWPTLIIAVLAFAIMLSVRRISPRLPNVLIAVAVTTIIAWAIGFENVRNVPATAIADDAVRSVLEEKAVLQRELAQFDQQVTDAQREYEKALAAYGRDDAGTLTARHNQDMLKARRKSRREQLRATNAELKHLHFLRLPGSTEGDDRYVLAKSDVGAAATDGRKWRLMGLNADGTLLLSAGGAVVGKVPEGLPAFRLPSLDLNVILQLLGSAIAIGLIGFMEAISIAKAMAARTRQRLDANQELVGQGLANIIGSTFQSYAISGSFSRSAVNLSAGAITGFSSVVTGLVVVITLFLFTPLLYHLPQATLAAVIMLAVIGLVNFKSLAHIWQISRSDGVVAALTFVLALAFAPHLDVALMIGVALSLIVHLHRTMKPRVAILARHQDGSLRDAEAYKLELCPNISIIRFDGSLYFADSSYFEDKVLERLSVKPDLRFIIVDAEGINQIDASGEEMLAALTERLEKTGIRVLFARTKKQVMDVLDRSGYIERFGRERFFRRSQHALEYAWSELGDSHTTTDCPLYSPAPAPERHG